MKQGSEKGFGANTVAACSWGVDGDGRGHDTYKYASPISLVGGRYCHALSSVWDPDESNTGFIILDTLRLLINIVFLLLKGKQIGS